MNKNGTYHFVIPSDFIKCAHTPHSIHFSVMYLISKDFSKYSQIRVEVEYPTAGANSSLLCFVVFWYRQSRWIINSLGAGLTASLTVLSDTPLFLAGFTGRYNVRVKSVVWPHCVGISLRLFRLSPREQRVMLRVSPMRLKVNPLSWGYGKLSNAIWQKISSKLVLVSFLRMI